MFTLYNLITLEELFDAWYRFRKGKSKKLDLCLFENNLENNIFRLHSDIVNGTYKHGRYQSFTVFDSKKRKINKAFVRDRIVHEFIRTKLESKYRQKFIRNSFASRKNKGSIKAIYKLQQFIRNSKMTLSLDVSKYFNSINHTILLNEIEKEFNKNTIEYYLCREVVSNFYNQGIPLGNSVSQVFSNIYLNKFDWIMVKKYPMYLRYNDDIRICINKFNVHELILISSILVNDYKLIFPIEKIKLAQNNKGIKFLGFVIFSNFIILSKETKTKILQRVNQENYKSYLGFIKHYNCHNFSQKIISNDKI